MDSLPRTRDSLPREEWPQLGEAPHTCMFTGHQKHVYNLQHRLGLLRNEKSHAVYYISSCHMLIDKALSSDKPKGHWFEADWLHCKRDALSSNRKVDGSRFTGGTQACHS